MPFKNDKQRKFLFAMDKNKQSNPSSTKIKVPKVGKMNTTSSPSLPAIPKMPKFGRVKKFFQK